ncbi:spore germination lipoprotein GerD [Bacillus sp. 2205SS5-2]|uniref:spore germination lipoprotein GerD n=1 Tax=Bacillus sp. 2205SS5-2 TaxID=3109031 RepID=UPI0030066295
MIKKPFPLLLLVILLTGCSGGESSNGQMDYEETKKMVVDILKTDDGKKAIQDVVADDKIKQELIMDEEIVKKTISEALTSEKGMDFWKESFKDPKFAESMAKSMKKENEKLLKSLMKDPAYQGMMMDLFKDPELQKEIQESLKSKEYREHLQEVIIETFESPLFKTKLQDVLMKAAEEMKGSGGEEKKSGEEEPKQESSESGEEEGGGEGSGGESS